MKILRYPKDPDYIPWENVVKCNTCKAILEYEEEDLKEEHLFGVSHKILKCQFCFSTLIEIEI